MMDRRTFLTQIAALISAPLAAPALAAVAARSSEDVQGVKLAATWQRGNGYQLGILEYTEALAIRATLDIPTRAHGLQLEPGGTLLSVARRPGDWLLRWTWSKETGEAKALDWRWIEPRRAFAGHVLTSADGSTVFTTELDLDSGMGLIGVRDAVTLEKRAEWATHGMDPHMLTWDASQPGCLMVANGGVPTQPETGRVKRNLHLMDSSIVRLDGTTGEMLGQWRLADPRLSLRHLAWNGTQLGIALQAEHDDPQVKADAPILARFDGKTLQVVDAPVSLAGYGGAISPMGDGFAIGCPRSQGVAIFGAEGFRTLVKLDEACPVAIAQGKLWAGGRDHLLGITPGMGADHSSQVAGIRLDNHWISL